MHLKNIKICLIHPSSDKSVGITLVLMQYFRITNKMGGWQHEREHSNLWLINADNRTLLPKVFLPALYQNSLLSKPAWLIWLTCSAISSEAGGFRNTALSGDLMDFMMGSLDPAPSCPYHGLTHLWRVRGNCAYQNLQVTSPFDTSIHKLYRCWSGQRKAKCRRDMAVARETKRLCWTSGLQVGALHSFQVFGSSRNRRTSLQCSPWTCGVLMSKLPQHPDLSQFNKQYSINHISYFIMYILHIVSYCITVLFNNIQQHSQRSFLGCKCPTVPDLTKPATIDVIVISRQLSSKSVVIISSSTISQYQSQCSIISSSGVSRPSTPWRSASALLQALGSTVIAVQPISFLKHPQKTRHP